MIIRLDDCLKRISVSLCQHRFKMCTIILEKIPPALDINAYLDQTLMPKSKHGNILWCWPITRTASWLTVLFACYTFDWRGCWWISSLEQFCPRPRCEQLRAPNVLSSLYRAHFRSIKNREISRKKVVDYR